MTLRDVPRGHKSKLGSYLTYSIVLPILAKAHANLNEAHAIPITYYVGLFHQRRNELPLRLNLLSQLGLTWV